MGLSFVKDMIEQLEGTITVKDRPEGTGSIFMIQLPVDHLIKKG
jgi:two-component system sensor histidine kinase YcbA